MQEVARGMWTSAVLTLVLALATGGLRAQEGAVPPPEEIELSIEQAVEMGLARSFDVRIARTE